MTTKEVCVIGWRDGPAVKALSALAAYLRSVPSTHIKYLTIAYSSSSKALGAHCPPRLLVCKR